MNTLKCEKCGREYPITSERKQCDCGEELTRKIMVVAGSNPSIGATIVKMMFENYERNLGR